VESCPDITAGEDEDDNPSAEEDCDICEHAVSHELDAVGGRRWSMWISSDLVATPVAEEEEGVGQSDESFVGEIHKLFLVESSGGVVVSDVVGDRTDVEDKHEGFD